MSASNKKQRTNQQYELLYHPAIPGRGEFIRLALEAAGAQYTDLANEKKDGYAAVMSTVGPDSTGNEDSNPVGFAPPGLRVPGAGKDGKSLVIFQTPNILLYLGKHLDLAGDDETDTYYVNQLALTALDLNNETHDTHHPIGPAKYYEDQKDEALKYATDFRSLRLPKYFSYFERTLKGNAEQGKNKYLVGGRLTYADTSVWQVLDGLYYAFPKEMAARKSEYPTLLQTFYSSVKEEKGLKEYLGSKRRLPYSQGVFRLYPELDRQ